MVRGLLWQILEIFLKVEEKPLLYVCESLFEMEILMEFPSMSTAD